MDHILSLSQLVILLLTSLKRSTQNLFHHSPTQFFTVNTCVFILPSCLLLWVRSIHTLTASAYLKNWQFPLRLLKYSRPYACICLMYSRKNKTKQHLLNEQEKEKSTNSWKVGVGGQNADHTCLTFHYKGLALRQSEMKTHRMVLSISLTGF